MQAMQQLVKLPEVAKTMQDMSREMMKAGIIEEMLEDTMESMEPEGLEEEAEEEVDKVHTYPRSSITFCYLFLPFLYSVIKMVSNFIQNNFSLTRSLTVRYLSLLS